MSLIATAAILSSTSMGQVAFDEAFSINSFGALASTSISDQSVVPSTGLNIDYEINSILVTTANGQTDVTAFVSNAASLSNAVSVPGPIFSSPFSILDASIDVASPDGSGSLLSFTFALAVDDLGHAVAMINDVQLGDLPAGAFGQQTDATITAVTVNGESSFIAFIPAPGAALSLAPAALIATRRRR